MLDLNVTYGILNGYALLVESGGFNRAPHLGATTIPYIFNLSIRVVGGNLGTQSSKNRNAENARSSYKAN